MATREVLPSTQTMFTKEEIVQFLDLLQVELPEEEVGREAAGGIGMVGPTQMWGSDAASCENGFAPLYATMSMHPVAVSDLGHESDHMGRRGVAVDAHADAVWVF